MTLRNWIVVAITFGFVAAAVVWWLERFEINKFHGEVRHYLGNRDLFEQWLQEKRPHVE